MKTLIKIICIMLIPVNLFFSGCIEKSRFVAGCFTETGQGGLNVFDFNSSDGTLSYLAGYNAGPNPSYLCFSGHKKLIYAINEVSEFKGIKGGGLTTLEYTGSFDNIKKVNEIIVPNGGPCFISITPDNSFLLIANYTGGSVAVVKLDENGIPEKVCDTIIFNGIGEKVSHAHMISSDPSGNRVYVTDLGLDRIMIYTLNPSSGKLIPFNEDGVSLPEGTGPRHFVFSKDGSKMYVMGELNSTVNVFTVDDKSGLIPLQKVSALREGFTGPKSSADIHISKSGQFLYGTNRGENSIVTYRIGRDGLLTLAGSTSCGGDWPRNFTIDPSGKFILVGNQRSGNISVFAIDEKSGLPEKSVYDVKLQGPACIKFKY